MESFIFKDHVIDFAVVYSKRKTVEIKIEYPNRVIVRAPVGLDKTMILEILESKGDWILKKLELIKARAQPAEKRFIDGEEFVYLGQVYRLAVVIDEGVRKPVVKLNGGELVITAPIFDPELLRTFVQKWYGEQVLATASKLVEEYVDVIGRRPAKIKVSSAKYGSSRSLKTVNADHRIRFMPITKYGSSRSPTTA